MLNLYFYSEIISIAAYNISYMQIKKKSLTTFDLFAGVGGIRLGFEGAGFKTIYAVDDDKHCQKTYNLNFKSAQLHLADIHNIKPASIPEFDILLAGFPCQPFSIAGYRQGFNDARGRGNLFFEISRVLKEKKPKGFMLENVKNLLGHDGGKTFAVIKERLSNLGYEYVYKVLNTMEYGNLPQNRERIYIVGFMSNLNLLRNFSWPHKTKLTVATTELLTPPPPPSLNSPYYYKGKPLWQHIKDYPFREGQVYQWRRHYIRINKKGVFPTFTANMGMGGHNVPIVLDRNGVRKIMPRECFRIQGFPEKYRLPDIADSHLYKQAGNSVSVSGGNQNSQVHAKSYGGATFVKCLFIDNTQTSAKTTFQHYKHWDLYPSFFQTIQNHTCTIAHMKTFLLKHLKPKTILGQI